MFLIINIDPWHDISMQSSFVKDAGFLNIDTITSSIIFFFSFIIPKCVVFFFSFFRFFPLKILFTISIDFFPDIFITAIELIPFGVARDTIASFSVIFFFFQFYVLFIIFKFIF